MIEILYCGVCHSDLHQARNDWGGSLYPMVPGHEIVGRVASVGEDVKRFKAGDLAGVGCMVDSCRTCEPCEAGLEQYCADGARPSPTTADGPARPDADLRRLFREHRGRGALRR